MRENIRGAFLIWRGGYSDRDPSLLYTIFCRDFAATAHHFNANN